MKSRVNYESLISVLDRTEFRFIGNEESVCVTDVSLPSEANQNSIVWFKEPRPSTEILKMIKANVAVVSNAVDDFNLPPTVNFLLVSDPKLVFAKIVNAFFVPSPSALIHPSAIIDGSSHVESGVYIGPNVIVGKNCRIGTGSYLMGNVFLYDNVEIGKCCRIHAGCVLGAPGSGYVKDETGSWIPFPQIGKTVLEDNVEVGALTYINRGAIGETRVRTGAKIGLSVCVGHNVIIGRDSMVIANSVIAGSCVLEDNSWIAHGATLRNGIKVGKNAFVGMGAVVTKNVATGETVVGNPAKALRRN